MTIKTKKELVDNLLRRRFGSLAPPPPTTLHMAGPRPKGNHLSLSPMHEARLDLEAMTVAQLEDLVRVAQQKDLEVLQAKEANEERGLFFHQASADADFAHWIKMPVWTLEEGISLSLGKNPHVVNWDSINGDWEKYVRAALIRSPFRKDYARRRELVERALLVRDLVNPIRPEVFLTWAESTFDGVPAELLEEARDRGKRMADVVTMTARIVDLEARLAISSGAASEKWPWGSHDTKLLRTLESAAKRFWTAYDPNDPSTANTNATVAGWLKEQGVADRVADIMAQILRADGLPAGPRR